MKRVIIREPHNIEVFEDTLGEVQPGEAAIDIQAIGICGSDLHTAEGLHPFVPSYPVLPGHEVAGVVRAVGSPSDEGLVGKHVALEPSLFDTPRGPGRWQEGRYNISGDLRVMGFQTPGAMAEQFIAPIHRLHVLPDDFSVDLGAFVEPTAVAVHAVRLPGSVSGMDVGVVGAGTIGLLVAQVARAYGAASVCIADIAESRQGIARELGFDAVAELPQNSMDVVFECVGVEAALRSSMLACRKGSTVVITGVFGSDTTLPISLVQDWELRLLGTLMYVGDDYKEAIRLLHAGHVQVDKIITHRYPLADAVEAFEVALKRGDVLKVMLYANQ